MKQSPLLFVVLTLMLGCHNSVRHDTQSDKVWIAQIPGRIDKHYAKVYSEMINSDIRLSNPRRTYKSYRSSAFVGFEEYMAAAKKKKNLALLFCSLYGEPKGHIESEEFESAFEDILTAELGTYTVEGMPLFVRNLKEECKHRAELEFEIRRKVKAVLK